MPIKGIMAAQSADNQTAYGHVGRPAFGVAQPCLNPSHGAVANGF